MSDVSLWLSDLYCTHLVACLCDAMGQHCTCMEQSRKYQRRQSDDVDTMDMERGDDDDDDQEIEVLVGHDQEIHEVQTAGLLADADKRGEEEEKEESEEQHMRSCLSTGLMGLDADYCPTPTFSPEERSRLLRSYQEATGVVDEGQLDLECIMCLDTFCQDNPKVRTLCNCGMNRTNFHMSCLLEWLNREANCPVCREYLFFED